MVEAVNDAALRKRRGEHARGEALEHYAWEGIGRDLARVVGELRCAPH